MLVVIIITNQENYFVIRNSVFPRDMYYNYVTQLTVRYQYILNVIKSFQKKYLESNEQLLATKFLIEGEAVSTIFKDMISK